MANCHSYDGVSVVVLARYAKEGSRLVVPSAGKHLSHDMAQISANSRQLWSTVKCLAEYPTLVQACLTAMFMNSESGIGRERRYQKLIYSGFRRNVSGCL